MKKILAHLKLEWWKYGLETIVVVMGILMAFALNNWNEDQKALVNELVLLKELKNNLETNVVNLEGDIKTQILGANRISFLIDHLNHRRPYHDSLAVLFEFIDHVPDIELASSAFETLKSSGLGMLSSDSLRQEVINLFEITYPYLLQGTKRLEDQFWPTNVIPFYIKHFQISEGKAVPNDYAMLLDDKEFINMLSMRGSLRKESTVRKRASIEKTLTVIALIEKEINTKR
jgi:hypothetical protein